MSFDITPAVPMGRQLIQSYGDGGFTISDQTYDHPVIIFPERTIVWKPGDLTAPTLEAFSAVFDADPPVDILLVGCGQITLFMPLILRKWLKKTASFSSPWIQARLAAHLTFF